MHRLQYQQQQYAQHVAAGDTPALVQPDSIEANTMHFFPGKVQTSANKDVQAAARYLQPEFDIENPELSPSSGTVAPQAQSMSPREAPLIHQRAAGSPRPAIAPVTSERGRSRQPRAQTPLAALPASAGEQSAGEQSAATVSAPAPSQVHRYRSPTPDCRPDGPTVGVWSLAGIGMLIGGLCATYIKR